MGNKKNPKIKVKRKEGETTAAFKGARWAALVGGVAAYLIGPFNAGSNILSEKGLYGMASVLRLFAAITIQDIRDTQIARQRD
jgi:uncharacterized membrane protein YiaA